MIQANVSTKTHSTWLFTKYFAQTTAELTWGEQPWIMDCAWRAPVISTSITFAVMMTTTLPALGLTTRFVTSVHAVASHSARSRLLTLECCQRYLAASLMRHSSHSSRKLTQHSTDVAINSSPSSSVRTKKLEEITLPLVLKTRLTHQISLTLTSQILRRTSGQV